MSSIARLDARSEGADASAVNPSVTPPRVERLLPLQDDSFAKSFHAPPCDRTYGSRPIWLTNQKSVSRLTNEFY
jgi:hypothetical protein